MNILLLVLISMAALLLVIYLFKTNRGASLHIQDFSSYSDVELIDLYCEKLPSDRGYHRLWLELDQRGILEKAQRKKDKISIYGKG